MSLTMISNTPYEIFGEWFRNAEKTEPDDPNAMALATSTAQGRPSVRMVLLKEWTEEGFVFYTNLESRKGQELNENPYAALCFHWKSLRKQIRIEGRVDPIDDMTANAYFQSRPRGSRIGAWASKQSRPLESRAELENRVAEITAKYEGQDIPRPPFWSGFILKPQRFEFWHNRDDRLHDRIAYMCTDTGWQSERLYP